MDDVRFRAAVEADVEAIVGLLADDPLGRGREAAGRDDGAYVTAFREIDANPNAMVLVIEQDGAVVGCAQINVLANLSMVGTKRGLVEGVRISPALRGQGLGRRMMDAAVDCCRDMGCGLVQLTTNKQRPEALAFYRRCGFENSHEGLKLYL